MNSTPNNSDYEGKNISDEEITKLRKSIVEAVASGDVEQEAYARTNLCNLLVIRGDERAFEELYPALKAIRRIKDCRHELMLCINFTDFLLERGETKRAFELSERALALSEHGFAAHYILALFNHGKVWAKGLGEPREAMKFYLSAIKKLEEIPQSNAEQKLQLIERLSSHISEAATTALSLKLYSEAESILRLLDPQITDKIRRELNEIESKKAIINAETLSLATFPPLDSILAAWRGKKRSPKTKPEAEQALKRMEQLSEILNLQEEKVRLKGLLPAETENETRNGAGGLVQLAQLVTSAQIDFALASKLAEGLPVIDDDLPCLCIFALQDKGLSESGVAVTLLRLCAGTARDKRLSARLHSILAIFLKSAGSLDEALAAYLSAEALLTDQKDIAERAKLCSEASSILLELSRAQEAFELAIKANELAQEAGAMETIANSNGNLGVSLMQMQRYEEALAMFEKLKDLQQSLGDSKGLEITRFNISACKLALDQCSVAQFDSSSSDPDELFNLATKWGIQGDFDQAVKCLEKGFALAAASGKAAPRVKKMRVQYARSLYSAGRLNEAIEQMKIAAKAFEDSKDLNGLHEAYVWLASVYTKDRGSKLGEYYANLALDIGRNLGDPETLAIDLAQLGQAKVVTKRYREAITCLEEARGINSKPRTKASIEVTLADALINDNRPKEAIEIYENLQSNKEYSADIDLQLHLLVGLAEAHQTLCDNLSALRFLEEAREIAAANLQESREAQVEIANRLGIIYLVCGKLEEAAHVLEEGIEQARQLRLKNRQLSLLLNLSNVLRETGDLAGSERILKEILKVARDEVIQEMELESLTNLGQITFSQEKYNQSLSYFQEAATIAQQTNDPLVEGICIDQIGTIYSHQGKPERAVEHHKLAAKLHGQAGKLGHQIIDLVNLSQAYLVLKEDELANLTVQQAQKIRSDQEKLTSKSIAPDWGLSLAAGLVAARLGNWKQARLSLMETINTLESMRGTVLSPMQKRQWAARKADAYTLVTEAAITAKDGPTAIEFNESNKTRFLQEILQRRAKRPKAVNEKDWLRYERAADKRAMLRARWRAGLSADDPDTLSQLKQAESEYFSAFGAIQNATEELNQDEAPNKLDWRNLVLAIPKGYTAVSIGAFHTGLGIICAGIGENGEPWATAKMFDSFTIADLSRLIFGDVEGGVDVFRLGLVLDDLPLKSIGWSRGTMLIGLSGRSRDSHQRRYQFNVRDPMSLSKNVITYTCKQMGEVIWPLILETLPAGSKNLLLVPSRGLNVLPLHAARLSDGNFVDERFNIAYAPSLSILAQANKRSCFSNVKEIGQVVNPTKDLLFADVEARVVAQNFDISQVTSLKGSEREIDTKRILNLLEKVDVFHYSGHAFFDREEPFFSGLLLAEHENITVTLTLKIILESLASIQSKLVVLSACETGKVEPTDHLEDFLGLPGGFLAAGANTVLASLWPTDDLATCLLFEKFYELWQPPTTISEALTAAQQWLRKDLTVDEVKKKLDVWLDKWPDLCEQIEELQWFWTAKTDNNAHPFKDEIFWAAFYLTGIPS